MTAEVCALALTILAEAAGEPTDGRQGVASVIWDEAHRTHRTMADTATNPRRYSCWRGRTMREMQKYRDLTLGGRKSQAWVESTIFAQQMVDGTFVPNVRATNYARTDLGNLWGLEVVAVIGHHTFYTGG
jgi:hypothetical protein